MLCWTRRLQGGMQYRCQSIEVTIGEPGITVDPPMGLTCLSSEQSHLTKQPTIEADYQNLWFHACDLFDVFSHQILHALWSAILEALQARQRISEVVVFPRHFRMDGPFFATASIDIAVESSNSAAIGRSADILLFGILACVI